MARNCPLRILFDWLVTARSCHPTPHMPFGDRANPSARARRPSSRPRRRVNCRTADASTVVGLRDPSQIGGSSRRLYCLRRHRGAVQGTAVPRSNRAHWPAFAAATVTGSISGTWCSGGDNDAEIEISVGRHTFCATGIMDYLTKSGKLTMFHDLLGQLQCYSRSADLGNF
jgi:hypothetical protein